MFSFHIFFIAIVQGITEFLPISSSAHLIMIPYIMKVSDQGVITRFIPIAKDKQKPAKIELLEPTGEDTPIGKFIAKRGIGIQQICFEVEDIHQMIDILTSAGVRMIDSKPRFGSKDCLIAFVHPKSTGGVLVELAQKENRKKP